MPPIAIGGLVAVCVALIVALSAIAVVQVAHGQAINLPASLTSALDVAVTALFGGALFFGHTVATANQRGDLVSLLAVATEHAKATMTTPADTSSSTSTTGSSGSSATSGSGTGKA